MLSFTKKNDHPFGPFLDEAEEVDGGPCFCWSLVRERKSRVVALRVVDQCCLVDQ